MKIDTVANRQKLLNAYSELSMPPENARQVERVVTVIEGPACESAS